MKMRTKHYHKVSAVINGDGKAELHKGHLLASIVTIDAGEDIVCVGVARCNSCEYETGVPLRRIGKNLASLRAKDHMLYETGALDGEDLRDHERLKEKGLVLTLTRDEFHRVFIEQNPFHGNSYLLDQSFYDE